MAASEAFRGSPQLVAFLRYVVEATLRGAGRSHQGLHHRGGGARPRGRFRSADRSDRARRGDAAAPRAHPLLRERRRARPVLIDLPLGSYVPVFRRVALRRRRRPVDRRAPLPRRRSPRRCALSSRTGVASRPASRSLLLGAGIYGGLDFWFDFNTPNPQTDHSLSPRRARRAGCARLAAYPVVFVGAFQPAAMPAPPGRCVARQAARCARALRRDRRSSAATPPASAARRRMTTQREPLRPDRERRNRKAGLISVAVRLTDAADGRVAFARTFERTRTTTMPAGRRGDRARGVGRAGAALRHHPGARARPGHAARRPATRTIAA